MLALVVMTSNTSLIKTFASSGEFESRTDHFHDGVPRRHMLLTPGTRLGPYTIETLIGSGGMGEVYKAHDGRLNRTVAIKRVIAGDVRQSGRTALPGDHPASDSRVRAVATAFGGMPGRVEEVKPRMMRALLRSERHLVSKSTCPKSVYVLRTHRGAAPTPGRFSESTYAGLDSMQP